MAEPIRKMSVGGESTSRSALPAPADELIRIRKAAIEKVQEEIASWGRSGLVADKAFFDDMSGDGD